MVGSEACLYYHTTSFIHKCVMAHERVGSVSVSCWGFGAVGNMIQQDIYTMPSSLCFTSHLHSECVESVWTHCRWYIVCFTHSVYDPHRTRLVCLLMSGIQVSFVLSKIWNLLILFLILLFKGCLMSSSRSANRPWFMSMLHKVLLWHFKDTLLCVCVFKLNLILSEECCQFLLI